MAKLPAGIIVTTDSDSAISKVQDIKDPIVTTEFDLLNTTVTFNIQFQVASSFYIPKDIIEEDALEKHAHLAFIDTDTLKVNPATIALTLNDISASNPTVEATLSFEFAAGKVGGAGKLFSLKK